MLEYDSTSGVIIAKLTRVKGALLAGWNAVADATHIKVKAAENFMMNSSKHSQDIIVFIRDMDISKYKYGYSSVS